MSAWSSSYYGGYGWSRDYGSLNLTATSPVQSWQEPFTVEEACSFMEIDPPDEDEIARYNQIAEFISGAREIAEIIQGRDLVRKQYDLSLKYWRVDNWEGGIFLRDPLQSVDLVQYTDSTATTTTIAPITGYGVSLTEQPGVLYPPYGMSWPSFTPQRGPAILIRFTSGYINADPFWRDAGARVKTGMKKLITEWQNKKIDFEAGFSAAENNWSVMSLLSYGALPRVK